MLVLLYTFIFVLSTLLAARLGMVVDNRDVT